MDESHHWLLASASTTIPDLLFNYRYDGHPILWEFILYCISRITDQVLVMQLLHGSIMICTSVVFLRFSPFPNWFKFSIIFSYFFLFEYGVIARNYSLMFLFLFLAITHLKKKQHSYAIIMLALLANTHLFGLLIAVVLFYLAILRKGGVISKQLKPILGFTLSVLFSIYVILPPFDHPILEVSSTELTFSHIADGLMLFFKSCFPIPDLYDTHFWNTNLFTSRLKWFVAPFALAAWFIPFLVPWRNKLYLRSWCLVAFILFFLSIYLGLTQSLRYGGVTLLFLIALIWLDYNSASYNTSYNGFIGILRKTVLIAFVSTQLISSLIFCITEITRPFSGTKLVADYLEANNLNHLPITSDALCNVIGLRNYLTQPIYLIDIDKTCDYCLWDLKAISSQKRNSLEKLKKCHKYMETNDINQALFITSYYPNNIFKDYKFDRLSIEKLESQPSSPPLLKREYFDTYLLTSLR